MISASIFQYREEKKEKLSANLYTNKTQGKKQGEMIEMDYVGVTLALKQLTQGDE